MKRIVAFLAAVALSVGIFAATSASAQSTPPPPPADASGDTLSTAMPPAQTAPTAASDPTTTPETLRELRESRESKYSYLISLGIGGGPNLAPDDFKDNYSPGFGGVLGFGVRRDRFTSAVTFGYNFFLANNTSPEHLNPDDLNVFTIFGDLRFAILTSSVRPYLVVCGGYYRQWIVDADYAENVLGYGGGLGLEVDIGTSRKLFVDSRYIQGRTRETPEAANTELLPTRLGVSWVFK